MTTRIELLDHGYIELLPRGTWGDDEFIIESARMSTDKGFLGWGPLKCEACAGTGAQFGESEAGLASFECEKCKGERVVPGDEKLLRFLWEHRHSTPFEFSGATFEIQAPIMVFREWHRHRTQWYSELSARYVPMPDLNYGPVKDNVIERAQATTSNRQASGMAPLIVDEVGPWLDDLEHYYALGEMLYKRGILIGIPKEIARLPVTVGRYSRMRAGCNLRNWLHFLTLRTAPNAQWEIRQYANAAHAMLSERFPRTMALFDEGMK